MIIIPARLASTRFPNKILTDVLGLPMVIRTARAVSEIDDVLIAADSGKVVEIAQKHGLKAILTSPSHNSGTDRIAEAAVKLGLDGRDTVINVQADEPFIEPEVVLALKRRVEELSSKQDWVMASCFKSVPADLARDPNLVKVVVDEDGRALYFSRAQIPYDRENRGCDYFGHLGLYGFTAKSLSEFCTLSPSALEETEKLEQLRALAHGKRIDMVKVESKSFGIDTKEDLARAVELFG
jgi:3-deoxy-manno-octulosonate cytidylyltransferase (CMP-KDO synthetase)